MNRDCRSLADITKFIREDKHRRSIRLIYGNKSYLFRTTREIKGANLLLKVLIEGSKEMEKLLTGTK